MSDRNVRSDFEEDPDPRRIPEDPDREKQSVEEFCRRVILDTGERRPPGEERSSGEKRPSSEKRSSGDERRSSILWYERKIVRTLTELGASIVVISIGWWLFSSNDNGDDIREKGFCCKTYGNVVTLYVVSATAGWTVTKISDFPPLMGMILAGIAIGNIDSFTITDACSRSFWFHLREATITAIVIQGCLDLEICKSRQMFSSVIKLSILPLIAEELTIFTVYHVIDNEKFTKEFGFPLSVTSSVIIIPSLQRLKRGGYFNDSNVKYLIFSATLLSEIVSDGFHNILVYFTDSKEYDFNSKFNRYALDISFEIVFGIVWGLIMIYVPNTKWRKKNEENPDICSNQIFDRLTTGVTVTLFFVEGFLIVFIKRNLSLPGISCSVGCGISSFIAKAGSKWKMKRKMLNGQTTLDENHNNEYHNKNVSDVRKVLKYIWIVHQPLVFGFIGTGFKFVSVSPRVVIDGLLVLVVGLIIRLIMTTFSVWNAGFNQREVLFINICWFPIVSVQSVIIPLLLSIKDPKLSYESEERTGQIAIVNVISILVTAPLGSYAIKAFGPKLLKKQPTSNISLVCDTSRNASNSSVETRF